MRVRVPTLPAVHGINGRARILEGKLPQTVVNIFHLIGDGGAGRIGVAGHQINEAFGVAGSQGGQIAGEVAIGDGGGCCGGPCPRCGGTAGDGGVGADVDTKERHSFINSNHYTDPNNSDLFTEYSNADGTLAGVIAFSPVPPNRAGFGLPRPSALLTGTIKLRKSWRLTYWHAAASL